jgi:hypothetical protein
MYRTWELDIKVGNKIDGRTIDRFVDRIDRVGGQQHVPIANSGLIT